MSEPTQLEMIKTEEKAFTKFAVIVRASNDTISIPIIYFDMVGGDYAAAAILDEILFWTLPSKKTGKTSLRVRKDGILWLAVTRAEWMERKRLGERQVDRGLEKLIELGLVEKSIHRFNGHGQMHLRVLVKPFFELYAKVLYEMYLKDGIEDDDPIKEINDLYEMMGMSNSPFRNLPNRESPNGDSESPFGDSESPKRDTLNIHQSSTNHPPQQEQNISPDKQEPSKKVKQLPPNSDPGWGARAGISSEDWAAANKKIQHERDVANRFEQLMGINPADWWSDKKLMRLLKFLLDKPDEELVAFAAYSRKEFSPLNPVKVLQNPDLAITAWPQAVPGKPQRYGDDGHGGFYG